MKTFKSISICILFLLSASTFSSELVRSKSFDSKGAADGYQATLPAANDCPPLLEKWVNDDFLDKKSWGLKYNSEAKVCQSQIQSFRDFLSKKKTQSSDLSDSKKLSSFFSDKFSKQINPAYKSSLASCNSLSPEKASAVQTRFYAAGTKFEAANSAIIDEVAYLDSVLPSPSASLSGIECTVPIWPEIKGKCNALKAAATECSTSNAKQKRFDDLVGKTQAIISQIEGLTVALHKCIDSFTTAPGAREGRGLSKSTSQKIKQTCNPIEAAIEIKKNEIPWIRGEDFKKLAIKKQPRPRNGIFTPEYDLSDEAIKKAISQQLTNNRNALAAGYKTNLENFRCLSNNTTSSSCDFEKIRTHLQGLPDVRSPMFSLNNNTEAEAKTYFDAESCLLERHEDRAQTKSVVDSAVGGIVLTAATFGIGEVIAGIRVMNTTSKAARIRQGLQGSNVGINSYLSGQDLKSTYDACSEETETTVGISRKTNFVKENVCSDGNSNFDQAKETETNCIISALLSAPSILPFVGAVPSLRELTKSLRTSRSLATSKTDREQKLADFILKTKTSGKQNRDLDFASTLTLDERYKVAEAITGKPLTESQKMALKKAHEAGGYDFDPNSPLTKEKNQILKDGGFSARESAFLRGNGVAGSWDDNAKNGFVGQTASIPRSDGSRTKATIDRVLERDANDNPSVVEVSWMENGQTGTKRVDIRNIKIDYQPGQKIFFGRSDGSFTEGTLGASYIDPKTGKTKYTVGWSENGQLLTKNIDADSASHIPPGGSTGNRQSTPPPPPRPEPNVKQSNFEKAASITPKSENKINFSSDQPEMVRIVESKGKVKSLRQIQQALNLEGNPSLTEIKSELAKRRSRYHPDKNPDFQSIANETSDVINDMFKTVKDLEKGAAAPP